MLNMPKKKKKYKIDHNLTERTILYKHLFFTFKGASCAVILDKTGPVL